MNRVTPPARLGMKTLFGLVCSGLLTFGLWACTDQPNPLTDADDPRAFSMGGDDHSGGDDDDDHSPGSRSKGPRATGGGKTVYPIGSTEKIEGLCTDKSSPDYPCEQTFGFQLRDANNNGIPDRGSQINFIDHRLKYRVNKKPLHLKSVGWVPGTMHIEPPNPCAPEAPGCCPRGAVSVQGYFDNKSTQEMVLHKFKVRVCDVVKKGSRSKQDDTFIPDKFWLQVPDIADDFGLCLTINRLPEGFNETGENTFPEGAWMVGGNIDVDARNATSSALPPEWLGCNNN